MRGTALVLGAGAAAAFGLAVCLALPAGVAHAHDGVLRVGSKRFTESYILGEVVRQTAERAGVRAEHKQGLGGTEVVLGMEVGRGQVELAVLADLADLAQHGLPVFRTETGIDHERRT